MESDLPKDSSADTANTADGDNTDKKHSEKSGSAEQKSSDQPDEQKTAQPADKEPNQSVSEDKADSKKSDAESKSSETSEKIESDTPKSETAEKKSDAVASADAKADEKPGAGHEIKHVVLVDDDTAYADTVRAHFQEKKISIQTYTSKKELEEKAFDHPPALLIMDIEVSGEDGRSLALDLRDAGKLGGTIIVLLTDAEMDKPTVEFTLKLGFQKILRKPVSANVLERLLLDEPRRKAAAGKKHIATTSSENLPKIADNNNDTDKGNEADSEAEVDDNAPLILSVKQSTPVKEVKTSAIAQAMSTAMSMTPVKGASPGAPKANVDKFAPPPAPPRAPTPAAKPAARSKADEKPSAAGGSANKGMLFGVIYSVLVGAILGFAVSAGYVHSLMIGEGVLIGIAAGIGLIQGWKTAELYPVSVMLGSAVASFAGWAVLLVIRAVTNVPFVERTAAMIQFTKEHPNHVREWGTSESTALGFIIGQLIVAFIVTMFLSRFKSTGKKTL